LDFADCVNDHSMLAGIRALPGNLVALEEDSLVFNTLLEGSWGSYPRKVGVLSKAMILDTQGLLDLEGSSAGPNSIAAGITADCTAGCTAGGIGFPY